MGRLYPSPKGDYSEAKLSAGRLAGAEAIMFARDLERLALPEGDRFRPQGSGFSSWLELQRLML
jgi:hypothetical protein